MNTVLSIERVVDTSMVPAASLLSSLYFSAKTKAVTAVGVAAIRMVSWEKSLAVGKMLSAAIKIIGSIASLRVDAIAIAGKSCSCSVWWARKLPRAKSANGEAVCAISCSGVSTKSCRVLGIGMAASIRPMVSEMMIGLVRRLCSRWLPLLEFFIQISRIKSALTSVDVKKTIESVVAIAGDIEGVRAPARGIPKKIVLPSVAVTKMVR